MARHQIIAVIGAVVLFGLLMTGFRTKPKKLIKEESVRALNLQSTSIDILIKEAIPKLTTTDKDRIQLLESQLMVSDSFHYKVSIYKELSSTWYKAGHKAIAGGYAEKVAQEINTARAWGIAGTTFAMAITDATQEKIRTFSRSKALETLENAISIDPENLEYQINRAVIYAQHPSADNPMRGIQLLLELNKNNPQNVPVINNLAKFALQTNQVSKAAERLATAESLEPQNLKTICLLAQLYERQGNVTKMREYQEKCGGADID